MTTKPEMIDWLERELANPPADGCSYGVWVGPDPDRGQCVYVHIPTEIVQEQIRKALEAMKA